VAPATAHYQSCPGLTKASTFSRPPMKKVVDGRVKPGHDGKWHCRTTVHVKNLFALPSPGRSATITLLKS